MPGGSKKVTHILRKTCSWTLSVQLQVCLSMCVSFLLPPGIKGLTFPIYLPTTVKHDDFLHFPKFLIIIRSKHMHPVRQPLQYFILSKFPIYGSRYSRIDQIKFVEDSLLKIWSHMTNFLKAVFHKFYLVRSWIPWPILNLGIKYLTSDTI